jgi:hypothetical protein
MTTNPSIVPYSGGASKGQHGGESADATGGHGLVHPPVVPCFISYRHIPPEDSHTPLMYLPMQRTTLDVREPCGVEEARDAIIAAFGPGWFRSRDDIRDIEIERHVSRQRHLPAETDSENHNQRDGG